MAKLRKDLAWLVQVTEEFGAKKVEARVVLPQENGELHNPNATWRFDDSGNRQFADLSVSAYLGYSGLGGDPTERAGELWGFGAAFYPHHIDFPEYARDIAKTLTAIEKGLSAMISTHGNLADGDFGSYLSRVGITLGITTFYVRTGEPVFFHGGPDKWKTVDVSTLQYWLREVCKYDKDEPSKLRAMLRG